MDAESARRLLDVLRERAPRARTLADARRDPLPLSNLIRDALREVPSARWITDDGALRELHSVAPVLGEALDRFLDAPWSREATIRAQIAGLEGGRAQGDSERGATLPAGGRDAAVLQPEWSKRSRGLGELLQNIGHPDPATGRAAEAAAVRLLSDLAVDLEAVARQASPEEESDTPEVEETAEETSAGGLIIPSQELIARFGGPVAFEADPDTRPLAEGPGRNRPRPGLPSSQGRDALRRAHRRGSANGPQFGRDRGEGTDRGGPDAQRFGGARDPTAKRRSGEGADRGDSTDAQRFGGTRDPTAKRQSAEGANRGGPTDAPRFDGARDPTGRSGEGADRSWRENQSREGDGGRDVLSPEHRSFEIDEHGDRTEGATTADQAARERAAENALLDLAGALAEAVSGERPVTWPAWRAAWAAGHVADFRPLALATLLGGHRVETLPPEHPGVPLSRPGAAVCVDLDARASASGLLAGWSSARQPALGAAAALTAMSGAFVRRALRETPSDPMAARRGFASAVTGLLAEQLVVERAGLDADALESAQSDAFGAVAPRALRLCALAEARWAGAPGEAEALYRHSRALRDAMCAGVALAKTLRDRFDEDWFLNPRATSEALRDLASTAPRGSLNEVVRWLTVESRLEDHPTI